MHNSASAFPGSRFGDSRRDDLPLLLVALLLTSVGVPFTCRAELLASESFESCAVGPAAGQGSGSGWATSWDQTGGGNPRAEVMDTTGDPLRYAVPGGGSIHGGSRAVEVQLTGAASSQLALRRQLAVPIGQTFYAGYLVRHRAGASWAGGNNTFTLHLATNATSTASLNFGLRGNTSAGSDEFVIRYGTGAPMAGAATGGQVETGTNYYVVARMNWNGAEFASANLWLNPGADGEAAKPGGDATLTGLSCGAVTHVFWREAVLDADDVLQVDELKIGSTWSDVVTPWTGVPAVESFTLMYPGTNGPVPGYDPITNNATVNLLVTGTNLAVRANTVPPFDFGSVALSLSGATEQEQTDNTYPWSLFGESAGGYASAILHPGPHTLTAVPYDGDQGEGNAGKSATVSFTVVNTVIETNHVSTNTSTVIGGERKKWHGVSLTWEGPETSETHVNNPFRNYRLNVTFYHPGSGRRYVVPGFYAADGNAADTQAESGNRWRVMFTPDEIGEWQYLASFRAGTDIALSGDPLAGVGIGFDGASGSFFIEPTDKTGRDHRGKGRLQYVGKHHLRFAETGEYFLKMGADSPENLLNYEDFDDQPNVNGQRKSWSAHAVDYDPSSASGYTWGGGKGTELLGAIKYLADKGLNAFSFIPFTLDGDDKNVFPHRLVTTVAAFQGASQPRWTRNVVYHDRFDVSKLDQWDRVFAYADTLGMYLHFKTLETENELTMDGGHLGPERTLYYRELIARFGYHLALNWNLGEEINDASTAQKQAWSRYFYETDPYHHHQVIHNGSSHYDLLGTNSHLTGFSRQTSPASIFSDTLNYLKRSDEAGVAWVVAFDEQNPADVGIMPDTSTLLSETNLWHDDVRGKAIWSHLLAGGAGCEFYFGYRYEEDDLECQNFRSRDHWWNQCRYALEFLYGNSVPFWNMTNHNALLTGLNGACCFGLTGQVYVAYLPTNHVTHLNLTNCPGEYSVRWFDPRHGGALQQGSITGITGGRTASLGTAPLNSTNDWVVLVRRIPAPAELSWSRAQGSLHLHWNTPDFSLQHATDVGGPWADIVPRPTSPYAVSPTNAQELFRLVHFPCR